MTKKSPTVLFFGSGPVAEKSLDLLQQHTTIEAVITKQSTLGAMKAITNKPVYSVSSSTELDELMRHINAQSKVALLIDFGIIVSQAVIDSFPLGIINSHFSLLPELRGADPITFAILSGQQKTGVSLMLLVKAMDEGPLLAQAPYLIDKTTTTPELTDELIRISDAMLQQMLPLYLAEKIQPMPQESGTIAESTTPTYSRKLTKEDGLIDWTKPAEVIEREIRAFAGWPTSYTTFQSLRATILRAHTVPTTDATTETPATVHIIRNGKKPVALEISCGSGRISIDTIKPEGKNAMSITAFLAGYANRLTDKQ